MSESASPRPPLRPRVSVAARRRRAILAAVLAVVVVAVIAAVTLGGSESAADTVQRAFGKGEAVKSAQVDANIALTGSAAGGDQPLNLAVKGPYEAGKEGRASFDLALGLDGQAAGGADGLGLLGAGGKTFLKLGGQPFEVSSAVVDDAKDDGSAKGSGLSFSSLGVDPRSWLKDPETVGDEELAGEDVTHVRSGVDVDRLGADLKKLLGKATKVAQTSSQKKEATQASKTIDRLKKDIKTARIDVWAADGEGALRRMKVDMRLTSGRVVLDLGLSKVNEPVKITAPKNALPLEQLLQAIQASGTAGTSGKTGAAADDGAASSGSGSGTASGTGSASGSGTAPGAGTSAYDECVAAAGTSVSKLQACADVE
ncbi:hypothetical protein [Patulibacter americanus]|uniref:hypothetical protein n=1 Tax=Patulibacter americanus TaxID=588672 RepID=UPI0003B3F496|nr:hypothetical protein [Patulibacter americanus]